MIKEEEEFFLCILEIGICLLDKIMNDVKVVGKKEISGVDVFILYDIFGFFFDLIELIFWENGMIVNEEEFNVEM